MTAPRPLRLAVTPRTAEILRRCYPGQQPALVLEAALILRATADGCLTADGRPRNSRDRRQP